MATYGLEQKSRTPRNAVVLERYDTRFVDNDLNGYLMFVGTGTLVGGKLSINVELEAGATVYVFPMTPVTVAENSGVCSAEYDVANYPPDATDEVLVAVFAHQSNIKKND